MDLAHMLCASEFHGTSDSAPLRVDWELRPRRQCGPLPVRGGGSPARRCLPAAPGLARAALRPAGGAQGVCRRQRAGTPAPWAREPWDASCT